MDQLRLLRQFWCLNIRWASCAAGSVCFGTWSIATWGRVLSNGKNRLETLTRWRVVPCTWWQIRTLLFRRFVRISHWPWRIRTIEQCQWLLTCFNCWPDHVCLHNGFLSFPEIELLCSFPLQIVECNPFCGTFWRGHLVLVGFVMDLRD